MKFTKLAALITAAVLTTGCGSLSTEQSNRSFEHKEMSLPSGLSNPKKSNEYDIPKLKTENQNDYSKITSPTTVLVLLSGSWIDEQDKHPARIHIEKPEKVENLAQFIEQGAQSFGDLGKKEIEKTANGYKLTQYNQVETGFWFWAHNVDVERIEYEISIDLKEHGRSGVVKVDLIDYQVLNKELAPSYSQNQRKESLAIQTLNDFMLELDYVHRINVKNEQSVVEITLDLVDNISGNSVLRSQQDIKNVWSNVDDVLEELGFSIEEEDRDLYIYDVSFDSSNTSSFGGLFGSEYVSRLELDSGEYEVSLVSNTTGVHIVFKDKSGNYLTNQQMKNIYQAALEIVEEDEIEL